ncbi:SH3 and cysteine-rich domain-containing protein isoform X2 [Lasioglossum baleicum]|uniref:SH3 and cysteine-rich domain-containing protein isoform X2 n=1 Tax=Lasioglossum baleicum TaxID=434251 RepID=UPI003FCE4361
MYVIYPADELLRFYENPDHDPIPVLTGERRPSYCRIHLIAVTDRAERIEEENRWRKKGKRRFGDRAATRRRGARRGSGPRNKKDTRAQDARTMQNSRGTGDDAAAAAAANPFKDVTQPALNEPLKQHNAATLKLVQTVAEFTEMLGAVMEDHSANVQRLVDKFRSRSEDTRLDTGGVRRVWENLLRQVEADALAHLDLAKVFQQQLSRPTLEASFYRKLQSRKVFAHREAYEQLVAKSEEKLQRARADYKRAYAALLMLEGGSEQDLKRAYFEAHNSYVLQLRATNAITERYQTRCLTGILGEIAEVYEELCGLACKCVTGFTEAAAERSREQAKRYQSISEEAQVVSPLSDLQILARSLAATATPSKKPARRLFVAPGPPEQVPMERINQVPALRDELAPTGTSTLPLMEDLQREHDALSQKISGLQEALDSLMRMQRKSAESCLYTKVVELQKDISMKRFELGEAQLNLAAVQAQKELFGSGEAGQPDGVSSRKMSNGSTGSTKHKWLKAFKSLKTSSPPTPPPTDKKSLESEGGHIWREYTYRKITPCDACGQVLRGHSRQGVRCRGCKANAHTDCIHLVQPAMCPSLAPKKSGGIPLLRRQKTQTQADEAPTSEHNVDAIYQVLKQAGEIRGNSTNSPPTPPTADHPPSGAAPSSARASSHPCSSSTSAPHSPQRRRERLNLRMKSLSLDSPEGTAHVRHRSRDYYTGGQRESTPPRHSDSGSINRLSPCSPGQGHGIHKHIRGTTRMSSMELPDENEKSYSSASTSPCPSPHTNSQNHTNPPGKRVPPPNNLYVALYNFDARHRDELDLKAGYKITVIDKSERDWWKGKCLGGRVGYFPSAYVMRVESGQKTLQVTRNLQLTDQITLLRDQIVIQVGEEVDGVAMVRCAADVRSADHTGKEGEVLYRETLCPLKYLQEV